MALSIDTGVIQMAFCAVQRIARAFDHTEKRPFDRVRSLGYHEEP